MRKGHPVITVTYIEEWPSEYKKKREKEEEQLEWAIDDDGEQVNEKVLSIRLVQVEPRKKKKDAAQVKKIRRKCANFLSDCFFSALEVIPLTEIKIDTNGWRSETR